MTKAKLIAIGVDKKGQIWGGHFGIASQYNLYDHSGNLIEERQNPYGTGSDGKHTHHDNPKLIVDLLPDCGVFIARRMGEESKKKIAQNLGVIIMITKEKDAQTALKAYLKVPMNKLITKKDKIADILNTYPDLKEKLIQRSSVFENLNNPIVFNSVGKVATIEVAAQVAGEDLETLLQFLNAAIGQRDAYLAQKNESGKTNVDESASKPQVTRDAPPDIEYEDLDARELEGYFAPEIIASAKDVPPGKGLKVVQAFEPVPLYDVLLDMGWAHLTQKISENEFHIYFYREKEEKLYAAMEDTLLAFAQKAERVPIVLQSATPVAYPVILRMLKSEALMSRVDFTELKVWEQTEKHLAWIAKGKADISFSAIIAISKLLGKKNSGIKLASVDVWDNFTLVTRLKDVQSFADLRGKTIHMPLINNAPPSKVTKYLMEATGVNPDDFKFIFGEVGNPFGRPAEIAQRLVDGEIESALLREPEASYALSGSDDVRVAVSYSKVWKELHPESFGLPNAGIVFKEEFLTQNPEVAKLFLEELEKAIEWVNTNPEEAAKVSYETMGRTQKEISRFMGRVRFSHVRTSDVQSEIQDYLGMIDSSGKLDIAPEAYDLGLSDG